MESSAVRSIAPLRIAMVIDVYDEPSGGGIISTQRFTEFLRRKHQVVVISSGETRPGKMVLPAFRIPFARNLMDDMRFAFAWPRDEVLTEAFSGVDIVHVQLPLLLGVRAVSIAKRLDVPVISTFHLQAENLLYNLGIKSQTLVDLVCRFFVRRVYNRSVAVICPSAFAESELRRYGLRVPTYVVSNGVLPCFRPRHTSREPDLEHSFVVVSVGRMAREKRHDVLIQAVLLSKYRDRIKLIVAGHGPLKSQLEKLASALPVPPRIGYLSEEELIRWLNIADLYAHPSEVELEGMAVLEAMACGLPVLIADARTSASKQFAINEHFLFRTNDPVHLASRIDYWIEHRPELRDARSVYLEKASQYRIEESVQCLERIYSLHIHGDRRN